jgi:hypothetical protein
VGYSSISVHVKLKEMSGWFSKDPVAAAKKKEEKEAKAVVQLRELLGSDEGQQAAQQLVHGEPLDVFLPPCATKMCCLSPAGCCPPWLQPCRQHVPCC